MKKNILIKSLFVFSLFFFAKTNVFASGFTCTAFGDTIYIDTEFSRIIKYVIILIQISVPIILVVMGTFDLVKGVVAQKEDEIKKGQQIFIKRLISGALVFFVIALVKIMIGVFAKGESNDIISCINCFIGDSTKGGNC